MKSHLHTVDVYMVLKTGKASFRGKQPWTVVEPCLGNPRKPPLQSLAEVLVSYLGNIQQRGRNQVPSTWSSARLWDHF